MPLADKSNNTLDNSKKGEKKIVVTNNKKQRQTNDWKEVHTINNRCAFSHTRNWTWKLSREIVLYPVAWCCLPGFPASNTYIHTDTHINIYICMYLPHSHEL